MGKKVNVYLDDEMLKIWNSVPTGQRGSIIKKSLRDYSKETMSPKQVIILKLKEQLLNIRSNIDKLESEKVMIEKELNLLESNLKSTRIDKELFFQTIMKRGKILNQKGANYRSFTGKSYYKIHSIKSGKIYIENLRTGRTNSNFSRKTTDLAIERLISAGGRIPIGQFIPVKMHEYTVVHLHPNLSAQNGFIIWNDNAMDYVSEDMVPMNQDLANPPPETWVSDNNWLAVTIDGLRGHICIYSSTTHWGSNKITIEMLDKHPHFNTNDGFDEQPWMTKYFDFFEMGVFYWGHHNLKGGGGGTHTVLTQKV